MSWINSKFSVKCTATAERSVSINNAWNGIISGYPICSTPGSGHENRSRSYIVITREFGRRWMFLSAPKLVCLSPPRPTVNSGSNWSRLVCSICFVVVSLQPNVQSERWRGSLLYRLPRSPRFASINWTYYRTGCQSGAYRSTQINIKLSNLRQVLMQSISLEPAGEKPRRRGRTHQRPRDQNCSRAELSPNRVPCARMRPTWWSY